MDSKGSDAPAGGLLEPCVQIARVEQAPAVEGRWHEAQGAMIRGLDALEQEYK
jgi:hypothetical protein